MHLPVKILLFGCCLLALLFSPLCPAQDEESAEVTIRLANGVPVEGTFKSAAPEGLTISATGGSARGGQSAKGLKTLPWKYLSAGTRWRYERPMLAELEAKRIKAEKAAKAKAEAAAKAAAAAAAKKAAGTNAAPPAAGTAKPAPAAVNTNQPKAAK